jgi:hypothetical protein
LGRSPAPEDVPNIIFGTGVFEVLPADQLDKCLALREVKETFKIFYKMAV